MKDSRLKLSKEIMALLVAGGITLAPLGDALAKTYTEGKFVRLTMEEEEEQDYYEYVVKEGDNLSKISEKICSFFRQEITTKYWPTLAFLNEYPRIIEPGDIIKFPKSFEAMDALNSALRKKGWTAKYIQKNDIYGKYKKRFISKRTIYSLLREIYPGVKIDREFVKKYLDIHGLRDKVELVDENKFDKDIFFVLTEWIPTLEDMDIEMCKPLVKTR